MQSIEVFLFFWKNKQTNAVFLYAADSMNRDTKYLDFMLPLLFLWK